MVTIKQKKNINKSTINKKKRKIHKKIKKKKKKSLPPYSFPDEKSFELLGGKSPGPVLVISPVTDAPNKSCSSVGVWGTFPGPFLPPKI